MFFSEISSRLLLWNPFVAPLGVVLTPQNRAGEGECWAGGGWMSHLKRKAEQKQMEDEYIR